MACNAKSKTGPTTPATKEVNKIAEEMNECEIPVNSAMRRSELENISERLDIISEDF